MKKIILVIILLIPNFVFANTYIEKKINWFTIKVVKYDLSSKDYEIKVVKTDDATNLWNLLQENNAITWVNWVFFCPTDYKWCDTNKSFTDNERYIKWEKFSTYLTTWDRAVFWWTKDKKPFIYQSSKINYEDEDKIYYGLSNYPLLLSEWKNMLEQYWDKWLIDSKMKVKWTRNFVCSDEKKENIYFWLVYDATLEELTWILRNLWCYDALNLDAWLSTTFMYNSKYIVWPQKRDILDGIAIERIGLDVKEIKSIADNITNILIKDIEKKGRFYLSKKEKVKNSYIKQLQEIRKKIYEINSIDLYEQNIVWELDRVWYQIEINNLNQLKLVNLINEITSNMSKLDFTQKKQDL